MTIRTYTPLSAVIPQNLWPEGLFSSDNASFLDDIAVLVYDVKGGEESFSIFARVQVMAEVHLDLPFLHGVSLILGKGGSPETGLIDADLFGQFFPDAPPLLELNINTTVLSLGFSNEIIRPVEIIEEDGKLRAIPKVGNVAIPLPFALILRYENEDWVLDIDVPAGGNTSLDIPTSMIGDTGVVFEAHNLSINFSGNGTRPDGAPDGWKGLFLGEVKLYVPELFNGYIEAVGMGLGTGGFYGKVLASFALAYDPKSTPKFSGDLAKGILGLDGGISSISLGFMQNTITEASVQGKAYIPFFEDVIDVTIGIDAGGGFTVGLADPSGLAPLKVKDILELKVSSMAFELKDQLLTIKLSGNLTPLIGNKEGLKWPSFQIKELSIDSKGNVHIDGGWINLPSKYSLDFHGFPIEITKLGFGKTDDGGKWVGFSGGLKLVEGMSPGASVDGLRIIWYDDNRNPRITLDGVSVELDIPGVLHFKGDVSYRKLTDGTDEIHRFDGAIVLELKALDIRVDGILVVGSETGLQGKFTFLAIYLASEFPSGIPLWATGLALYGVSGLFALNMEPNKGSIPNQSHPNSKTDEGWYEDPTSGHGWYKREPVGITDFKSKWDPKLGSLAFGAGAIIGTYPDNGNTFNGKFLLAVILPGPIILLEGRGDLLKKRAEMDKAGQKQAPSEPRFRALAVLDGRRGSFEIGMDARYKKGDAGQLLDIRGGADAYFNLHNGNDWHIYVGRKEPREKRVQAVLFRIFKANAYLMLDAHSLATGAWVGFSKGSKPGPIRVSLEAWIEANAILNWMPEHLTGDLWLHGRAELKVFGFGAEVTLDAQFSAEVFDPYHVLGKLAFNVKPPWPLPRIKKTIVMEWGGGSALSPPPLPLPLKDVSIEHLKVVTKWPLPRTIQDPANPQNQFSAFLRPNYDLNGDGFRQEPDTSPAVIGGNPPPQGLPIPVVPLDCRPCITFSRPVNDCALMGVSPPAGSGWEQIGDPGRNQGPVKVRYSLSEVSLWKWDGSKWTQVASTSSQDDKKLYSSWAPLPDNPDGGGQKTAKTKLMLWVNNPFYHSRSAGDAWNEWFTDRFPTYPRQPDLVDKEICCNFEGVAPKDIFELPWQCPENQGMVLVWRPHMAQAVIVLDPPVQGLTHALCIPRLISTRGVTDRWLLIQLKNPAKRVRITVLAGQALKQSRNFKTLEPGSASNPWIEDGIRIFAYASNSQPQHQINVVLVSVGQQVGEKISGFTGFSCGPLMEITLPCASPSVTLEMTVTGGIKQITAFNADDSPVKNVVNVKGSPKVQNLIIRGTAINRLRILSNDDLPAVLHGVSFDCSSLPIVTANGFDKSGRDYGPVSPQNSVLDVQGTDLTRVYLTGTGQFCVIRICATYGPSPEEADLPGKANDYTKNELVRWSQRGNILEPHTAYRLKIDTTLETRDFPYDPGFNRTLIQTEYAYFRTDGQPGLGHLSVPVASPDAKDIALSNDKGEFVVLGDKGKPSSVIHPAGLTSDQSLALKSTLNSLENYVRQTIPPTIVGASSAGSAGSAGADAGTVRLAYRAYDMGVAFNENYVKLMYRLKHRDLGLYVYDKNKLPAADASGRRVSFASRWIDADSLVLDKSEERWISAVVSSGLANFDPAVIPKDNTLMAISEGQILEPATAYDARLMPLLLFDDFTSYPPGSLVKGNQGALDSWAAIDIGTIGKSSSWEVKDDASLSRWIIQTSGIMAAPSGNSGQQKPGTVLVFRDDLSLAADDPRQPSRWADYRLRVSVQSNDDGLIGAVFRYIDPDNFYMFFMDRQRKRRRLASVVAGVYQSLAEDGFAYNKGQTYSIVLEAVGRSLRVYQDGAIVFDVADGSLGKGSVGLCCSDNSSAGFSDVNVDDLGAIADVVYGFSFVTSRFANFFHHMHSFQDASEQGSINSDVIGPLALGKAVPLGDPPTDEEFRAYEDLASRLPDEIVSLNPLEVHVTVINQEKMVFLLRSPEPMDWSRMDLEVRYTDIPPQDGQVPLDLKLTDVSFGVTRPIEESVTVLLREESDLSGYRIEFQSSPLGSDPQWTTYYIFGDEASMPPGTRVTVYAGNSSAPGLSSPKPGQVQRFVALGNDQGQIRLTSGVAFLRLIAPDGTDGKVIHSRNFVADGRYNLANSGVVRKADGTSLFIFLPDAPQSEAKLYRLKMTYYKDNTAKNHDSQVLSQGGDKDPENVNIDIPWRGFI